MTFIYNSCCKCEFIIVVLHSIELYPILIESESQMVLSIKKKYRGIVAEGG